MPRRAARCAALFVMAPFLLCACGANDGQGSVDRPVATTSQSPTRTLPSPTRSPEVPELTGSASPRPSRSLTPPPDTSTPDTPSLEPTTPEPSASRTRPAEPASQQPTVRTSTVIAVPVPSATSPPPSLSPSPSPAGKADENAADEALSPAGWILLAVLAAAAATGTWLLVRARRRRSWLAGLEAATAEVEWFARELIPQLRASGSLGRVAGGWQVALPRVAAVEDQLTVLESSAHNQQDAARARQLRDAVRSATAKMETLSGAGRHDEWALDLDDVGALLAAALGPTRVDSPGATSPT
jgi:hypothetical protein